MYSILSLRLTPHRLFLMVVVGCAWTVSTPTMAVELVSMEAGTQIQGTNNGTATAAASHHLPLDKVKAAAATTGISGGPDVGLAFDQTQRVRLEDQSSRFPLGFVPNIGQVDPKVHYYAKGPGYAVYFTDESAVITLAAAAPDDHQPKLRPASFGDQSAANRGVALGLRFLHANPNATITARGETKGTVNYLVGNDRALWRTGLNTYGEVVYRDLWPGIDLVFYGERGKLKYDFVVDPGASVGSIRLAYAGADDVFLDNAGNLRIVTSLAELTDEKPVSYQLIDGKRVPVDVEMVVGARGQDGETPFGFAVSAAYDPRYPLVIDPGLEFSTFVGGSTRDFGIGVAVDESGNVYLSGQTTSLDFPTTLGVFDTNFNGGDSDVFVIKLAPGGDQLLWSTYLGGSQRDRPLGDLVLDDLGNIYLTGQTLSSNFPTTAGALDTSYNGNSECFIVKLTPTADNLVFSTYLGANLFDACFDIELDGLKNVYVLGETESFNFPTTAGAFQPSKSSGNDAFVTKLTPNGTALVYSTFLGGGGFDAAWGIAVDGGNSAYVIGYTPSANFPTTAGAFDETYNGGGAIGDAYVAKLSPVGDSLLFSTFLGGSGSERGLDIALDSAGNAYVSGETDSTDFPTTTGAYDELANGDFDAFVAKIGPAGSLLYSTLLGGSGYDRAISLAVDAQHNAYVTGRTASADFATTPGAFDETFNGGTLGDAYVAKISSTGDELLSSTFLGGSDTDRAFGIAVDGMGIAYVTGLTKSLDFPTTTAAFDETFNGGLDDAFVVKIPLFNEPPTADAGTNQAIHVGQTVNLDGTGSFDDTTASENLLYSWSFTSTPAGSTAVLSGADTAMPSFAADVVGTFVIQLIVEDEAGSSSEPDMVEVSSTNVAPEADAGNDQVIILSQTAVLDGSGSSDADSDPLSFIWSLTSTPVGSAAAIFGANTATPFLTPDLVGVYELALVVNDRFVNSAPDSVLVTAITAADFAQMQLLEANDVVTNMPDSDLDSLGHRQSLTNLISQVIDSIQKGKITQAITMLDDIIRRTDGCALRGAPDGDGNDRDWITDCTSQGQLYPLLISAKAALEL